MLSADLTPCPLPLRGKGSVWWVRGDGRMAMETRATATAAAARALFQRMMRAAREQARLTVRPLGRIGRGAPGALRSAALVVVLLAGVLAQLAPVLVTAPVAHANPASP